MLFILAIVAGFSGYSLPDDLLSGTDLVPALEMALLHTFDPTTGDVAVSDDMAAKDAHRPAGPAGTRGDR